VRAWTPLIAGASLLLIACDDAPKTAVAAATPVQAATAIAADAQPAPDTPPAAEEPAEEEPAEAVEAAAPTPRTLTAADIVSDEQGDEGDGARGDVATEGELLPGKDSLPIMKVSLVRHLVASKHLDSGDFVLDRVKATLSPTASVGEVNEALEETGARVCELSRPQIPFRVTLCIPLQPDRDGVQAVADALKGFSSVVHAEPYRGAPAHATRAHVE
jgi:hypothetical protein